MGEGGERRGKEGKGGGVWVQTSRSKKGRPVSINPVNDRHEMDAKEMNSSPAAWQKRGGKGVRQYWKYRKYCSAAVAGLRHKQSIAKIFGLLTFTFFVALKPEIG